MLAALDHAIIAGIVHVLGYIVHTGMRMILVYVYRVCVVVDVVRLCRKGDHSCMIPVL